VTGKNRLQRCRGPGLNPRQVEISPVFPIDIDIAKDNVNKLTHKEYVESVEHKNKKIQEKKVMV
jgi:hypothetical protein